MGGLLLIFVSHCSGSLQYSLARWRLTTGQRPSCLDRRAGNYRDLSAIWFRQAALAASKTFASIWAQADGCLLFLNNWQVVRLCGLIAAIFFSFITVPIIVRWQNWRTVGIFLQDY